jgi:hypothetical protein
MGQGCSGLSPETWKKFDRGLKREIERHGEELDAELPVLIRLTSAERGSPGGQGKSVQQKEAEFSAEAAELMEQLKRGKARDIQRFWINRTVAAKATIATICGIAERPDVAEILLVVQHKAII